MYVNTISKLFVNRSTPSVHDGGYSRNTPFALNLMSVCIKDSTFPSSLCRFHISVIRLFTLQTSFFRFNISVFGYHSVDSTLPCLDFTLQILHFRLQTSFIRFNSSVFTFQIPHFRLQYST